MNLPWFAFWPLVDNPLYDREVARSGRWRLLLHVLVVLSLACLYAGLGIGVAVVAGWIDQAWAMAVNFLTVPAGTLLHYVPPAMTALALADERNAGTLQSLILSTYSRQQILAGLLLGRLRPLLSLLRYAGPAMLAGGCLGGIALMPEVEPEWAGMQPILPFLGVLAGGLVWLLYVGAFWFSACCGAWAALRFPQTGAAIAIAYVLLLVVPQILACAGVALAVPVMLLGSTPVYWGGGVLAIVALGGFYFGVPWLMWRSMMKRVEGEDLE